MRGSVYLFLMYWLLLCCASAPAASLTLKEDSLMKLLLSAKQDTDKIKLRCDLGFEKKISHIGYWDSILNDTRKYNLPLYECRALSGLGRAYSKQGNKQNGIACFNKSIALSEERGYKAETILLINRLLDNYRNQLEQKKILDLNYKGLKLAGELNDKRAEVDFYSTIATCYFLAKDMSKALTMHFNCLKICKELDYHMGIVTALGDIGSDYYVMNDAGKAKAYNLACGEYVDEFEGTLMAAYIYNGISAGYEITGEGDSAYKYSVKARDICIKFGNKAGLASSMVTSAKSLYLKHDVAGAKKKALEAMALTKAIGFTIQIPDLALFIKKIYLEEKNYKAALDAYELYITVRDSISDEKTRKQALEKEFAYNYENQENANKLLAQQNQIQLLQLNQNKYLLFGLGSLLIFVLFIAYLLIRQNKLNAMQKNAQMEQKLLRAQMNPHFIFNSLTAIQQFIMKGQNEPAERYLSKFSKLMRELLESNIKENISIKEEAEILTGYIEMESLRFGKSFSYIIKINENIEAGRINIPHMMIQPFVENAIWHGLLNKAGDRELSVVFESDNAATITCIIEDNGVGRTASMAKKNTFKKQSLALSLVKQRLDLMARALKVSCRIDIIDKADESGQSLGTKIIITLPILR